MRVPRPSWHMRIRSFEQAGQLVYEGPRAERLAITAYKPSERHRIVYWICDGLRHCIRNPPLVSKTPDKETAPAKMNKQTQNDREQMRYYLLGLDTAGLEDFEERMFADDVLYLALQEEQDALIDDFLTGQLTADEARRFWSNTSCLLMVCLAKTPPHRCESRSGNELCRYL